MYGGTDTGICGEKKTSIIYDLNFAAPVVVSYWLNKIKISAIAYNEIKHETLEAKSSKNI